MSGYSNHLCDPHALIFSIQLFIWVILRLYTEFQSSIMPGSGQINFPGRVGGSVAEAMCWVAGLIENKANNVQSAKLKLSWV